VLMSIELMLNAANLNFIALSWSRGDVVGQIFTLFVICVAAGEVAIGLAILVALMRNRDTINIDDFNLLKG
jgi:NADH-quinone oxidoreductase subunit K